MIKKQFWWITCLVMASFQANAEVTTLSYVDFEQGTLGSDGWNYGSVDGATITLSTDRTKNFGGSSGSMKGTYPIATGAIYAWYNYNISKLNTGDVYVEFDAKVPAAVQGVKFLKIFGGRSKVDGASSYANATFGMDYNATPRGNMCAVSYGDGTDLQNDTQVVILFDRDRQIYQSRTEKLKLADIKINERACWSQQNWGDKWHHFKYHVKFNSGTSPETEVADGEFYVEIDGKVYVNASKLLNRHYTNPSISNITLYDWAQNGTEPFELWFDNIRVTTGGFYSPSPKPPKMN